MTGTTASALRGTRRGRARRACLRVACIQWPPVEQTHLVRVAADARERRGLAAWAAVIAREREQVALGCERGCRVRRGLYTKADAEAELLEAVNAAEAANATYEDWLRREE